MEQRLQDLAKEHQIQLPDEILNYVIKNASDEANALGRRHSLTTSDWEELIMNAFSKAVNLPVGINLKRAKPTVGKLTLCYRMYKLQLFWLFLFYAFQASLFGIGVARYLKGLSSSPYPYLAADLVGMSFGLVLEVDCAILLLFPAFRATTGFLRGTFVACFIPFDSWIRFHIIVACTVCAVAVGHVTSFLVSLCK